MRQVAVLVPCFGTKPTSFPWFAPSPFTRKHWANQTIRKNRHGKLPTPTTGSWTNNSKIQQNAFIVLSLQCFQLMQWSIGVWSRVKDRRLSACGSKSQTKLFRLNCTPILFLDT
eukprot:2986122-Amphidinium_carterae.1